jgi:succinate dehydrogenase / fumarate reductase iron-sulfur subunit
MKVNLKIYRFDPEKDDEPQYQTYEVEAKPSDRILDCLNTIHREQDPTLSFRMSCGHGICGSDGMTINGVSALSCQKLVKDYEAGKEILIEPLKVFKVVKDLIVDQEPFFEKYHSVRPHLIEENNLPEKERIQSQEDRAKFDEATRCILCACCTAACPVNQSEDTTTYIGPAALVRGFRFINDSRDVAREERLALLDNKDGAWGCQTFWKCSKVCPKGIQITIEIASIKKDIFDVTKHKK